MKKRIYLIIAFYLLINCQPNEQSKINIWYGNEQSFGQPGNTQRQINLLGNLDSISASTQLYFTLNKDTTKSRLTLGSDLHRLAEPGDFNIEIDRQELHAGENLVMIYLYEGKELKEKQFIKVKYTPGSAWPLPYQVDWQQVDNMQKAVQVVDGHWQQTEKGLQTVNAYYDRIIAAGDSTWQDYEIETSVIFHGYNPPVPGPPTYNVSHVALAVRWPGHDLDSLQPNRKWYPLGATAEFRITDNYDSCRWRIFDGEHFYAEQKAENFRNIEPERKYMLKHRVQNTSDTTALYQVKLWPADRVEPHGWDFEAIENLVKSETGSACLIAHHTNVTFGNISVKPVSVKAENQDSL